MEALSRLKVMSHRLFETWATLEVLVKCSRNIENTLDMCHAERFAIVDSQSLGCADCVLDLNLSLALPLGGGLDQKLTWRPFKAFLERAS